MLCPNSTQEHIIPNKRLSSFEQIKELLTDNGVDFEVSPCGGFFVNNNNFVKTLFDRGLVTIQGMSSI
ncbi:MAG: hypothetical protein RR348_05020, partial [Clostridia bacterium]